ncbi:MAG: hypothetical protein AAFO99_00965 [Bacteroidota bacterium]
MQKLLVFCLLALLFSCDDGDLQIETIDFDGITVQACDSPINTDTELFFKIDGDEALILELQSSLLQNATATGISSSIPGQSQLTYRFFSGTVSNTYFCSDVPPATPTVMDEIGAEGGTVNIGSSLTSTTTTVKTYTHEVDISDLTLVNSLNERLTDESGLDYGDINTTTDTSTELVFENYADIAVVECENVLAEGFIRLYKIINDEFIALDIPVTALANMATTLPREVDLATTGSFRNYLLNTPISAELACETMALTDENTIGEFFSSEGTIQVNTVENEPDTEGLVSYTHTITITDVLLTLRRPSEETDVVLQAPIETITFGDVVTFAN